MKFASFGSVRYCSFESMSGIGAIQAFFTRCGGVSLEPYATLNTGGTVGDDPLAVSENRQRCFNSLDRRLDSMYDVWQVHSTRVVVADSPRAINQPHLQADILLTNNPRVTLFMRFADCVPIILVDPVKKAIGMAHAGWIGTVHRAASEAVKAMQEYFGCLPGDLVAGIGPSIGVEHYPVGHDVCSQFENEFKDNASDLLVRKNGNTHLDLWKANEYLLKQAGILQIETSGICTACHLEDWFSHRGEHGKTGRFGALLALADK